MSTASLGASVGANPKKWELWVGWILTAIPAFMLLMSVSMKFAQSPEVIEGFTGKFGYVAARCFAGARRGRGRLAR